MSAIGDYVHYSTAGYMGAKGYSTRHPPYFRDFGQSVAAKEAQIKNYINRSGGDKMLISKIETNIDNVLNYMGKKGRLRQNTDFSDDPINGTILQEAGEYLYNHFDHLEYWQIREGGFQYLSGSSKGLEVVNKRYSKILSGTTNYNIIDILIKDFSQLQEILPKSSKSVLSKSKTATIEDDLKKVEQDLQDGISEIMSIISNNSENFPKTTQKMIQASNDIIRNNSNVQTHWTTIIENINRLISFARKTYSATNLIGAVGEVIVERVLSNMDEFARETAENEIQQCIEKNVTGSNAVVAGYTKAFFTPAVQKRLGTVVENYQESNDDYIITNKNTKGKSDVSLIDKNNNHVGFSVKNYSEWHASENGVSVLGGMPFLSIIQNENDYDFVNHYLNVNAYRPNNKYDFYSSADRINHVMRDLVVLKAISGQNVSRPTSENYNEEVQYFVYIDNTHLKAKVYSVDMLIDKIINANLFVGVPTALPNDFVKINGEGYCIEGAQQRIARMIAALHAQKMYVKIPANLI